MEILLGFILTIASGVFNGSFAAPVNRKKGWEWENTWLIYALFGMILLPLTVTLIFIQGIIEIYLQVPVKNLLQVFLFGLGWGTGSVLFSLAIRLVGFSIAYTIVIGGIAAFGTLIPFLIVGNASLFSSKGLPILLALMATVTGISLCAWANKLKEKGSRTVTDKAIKKNKFGFGNAVCVAAAILSSMLNLAFHFGRPIADKAVQLTGSSNSPFIINHTVWVVALSAGFIHFFWCTVLT